MICKSFDKIDMGFNNRANVCKFCHGDALRTLNPCPVDLNDAVVEPGLTNFGIEGMNNGVKFNKLVSLLFQQ